MKLHIGLVSLLFFIVCQPNILWGQDQPDKISGHYPDNARKNAEMLYAKTIGEEADLYNGRAYNFRYLNIRGTPFYEGNTWHNGFVVYDNQLYRGINMKYNIYNDVLIIEYYNRQGVFHNLWLVKDRIQYFGWPEHYFIHLKRDTLNAPDINAGFYDLLYNGKIRVLVRYTKTKQKNTQTYGPLEEFGEKDFFFIEKNGKMFGVKKKRSIPKVLNDKEHEINVFIKSLNIKFKRQPGLLLTEVAKYYDSVHDK